MESDPVYLPLQQPAAGYDAPGAASGAVNYTAQQAPASLYFRQQGQGSGGGGSGAAQAAKTYNLPDPDMEWSSNLPRYPRIAKLPLYVPKKETPKHDQIRQQGVANCYLAATLAAMANTDAGRKQIKKMITPKTGAITTICKKFDQSFVGPDEQLKSDRWFTVAFKDKTVDVSNVLYHDDSDSNPNLVYMTTPGGDKALWGAIIEVAYAKLKGNYDNMSATKGATVDQFLDEFSAVKWNILFPNKDEAEIKEVCKNAGKRAAFIATKPHDPRSNDTKILTPFHGIAVLGMSGANVKLWDPLKGKAQEIKFKDLLTEVQAVIGSS
jgi:Calpain family cysteine protease